MKYLLLLLLSCSSAEMQQVLNTALSSSGGLSKAEIGKGLKEALFVGLTNSVLKTSKKNGYLGNSLIKIPFPKEASVVKNTLSKLGMNSLSGKVETSLNRAAENAATAAKPIFMAAITKLTFADVMGIYKGGNNAATEYLKKATTNELQQAFRPSISSSLKKVHATKYWGELMGRYNKIPFMKKVNPDLTSYVTSQAITGLFKEISKEEGKIRQDPKARTSTLLKRVFGALM